MSRLWYRQPAGFWEWEEALPVGNGRLGGMVYGRTDYERIQLNEESIWYGKPLDRNNPDALGNLEKIRELIFGGETDADGTFRMSQYTADISDTGRFISDIGSGYRAGM